MKQLRVNNTETGPPQTMAKPTPKSATLESALKIMEALESLDQGVSIFDEQLNLVAFNSKFRDLLQFPETLVQVGVNIAKLFEYNAKRGEYGEGDWQEQVAQRLELAHQFIPHRFERVRPDGCVLEIVGNTLPSGGFVTTYTDISKRRALEQKIQESKTELERRVEERTHDLIESRELLKKAAMTDPLTGLANRRHLSEKLRMARERAKRLNQLGAVLFLDLDEFKAINDQFGHDVGDWVLVNSTKRLLRCVRKTDSVARLDGDEFVVVLEMLQKERNAVSVAQQIIRELSRPHIQGDLACAVGVSVGIAFFQGAEVSSGEILRRADTAMYKAKQEGKGCFNIFPGENLSAFD